MVNFNKILTLVSVSTLCNFVAAGQTFVGECKNLNKFFNKNNIKLNYCYMNDDEEVLRITISGETINQKIINTIGDYNTLEELTLDSIKTIPKNISLEPLYLDGLIIEYDYDKPAGVIPKGVLKTAKNINKINLSNQKISQRSINEISSLTKLETLVLSGNTYEKGLDFSNLKKAKKLTTLKIQYDDGEGNPEKDIGFPESFCKITNLKELSVGFGLMTTVPKCIGNLKNLKSLNLSHNNIRNMPKELGKLTNLKNLNLSHNYIMEIPLSIEKLTKLEILSLDSNAIEEFSSTVAPLKNLKQLYLSKNEIKTIPEDVIAKLKNLEVLYLTDNFITVLPEALANLKKLTLDNIFLSGNDIRYVPDSLKGINLENY